MLANPNPNPHQVGGLGTCLLLLALLNTAGLVVLRVTGHLLPDDDH